MNLNCQTTVVEFNCIKSLKIFLTFQMDWVGMEMAFSTMYGV